MFRKIMIGFFATYLIAGIFLLLKTGFWIIPEGVLFREGENLFLPFLLFQLALVYLATSLINEKRIQILVMLVIVFLSMVLSIRELVDVITEQVRIFSRPLVLVALGQGFFALAYLIDFAFDIGAKIKTRGN